MMEALGKNPEWGWGTGGTTCTLKHTARFPQVLHSISFFGAAAPNSLLSSQLLVFVMQRNLTSLVFCLILGEERSCLIFRLHVFFFSWAHEFSNA